MRFREFLESYDKLGSTIKKGHSLEARGTKGPDKKEWSKSFKDKDELDAWVKANDAKVFGIAYAKKVTESIGSTPWEIINDIVTKDHNEESIFDLTVTEVGKILDLGKADELAKKEFFNLPEGKMKALVNAHPELLKGKAASRYKKQLTEASPDKDGIMPLSYKAGAGHKIEAYGVKGMKNTQWRKTFKNREALDKWVEANDAEIYGTAQIKESVEQTFIVTVYADDEDADDLTNRDLENFAAILKNYGQVSNKVLRAGNREIQITLKPDSDKNAEADEIEDDIQNNAPDGYSVSIRSK